MQGMNKLNSYMNSCFSGSLQHVVWLLDTTILEDFNPEDVGSTILRNVDIQLPHWHMNPENHHFNFHCPENLESCELIHFLRGWLTNLIFTCFSA